MSPVAAAELSLARRFFGLAEVPLYAMLSIACGLAVYTPIRHLTTAPDITLDRRARDFGDNIGENPRVLQKAVNYRSGILGGIASYQDGVTHVLPDVGVPHAPKKAGWTPPKTIPQPPL